MAMASGWTIHNDETYLSAGAGDGGVSEPRVPLMFHDWKEEIV